MQRDINLRCRVVLFVHYSLASAQIATLLPQIKTVFPYFYQNHP